MNLILKAARQSFIRLGRDESGAAFLVTLAVFMFMFLLCSGVYSIGDIVRQRIELQNAADAAAYSAAVIQADTISRVATINRAMAWTYLQMTRRQMDYIVDKWVELTETRMKEDRAKMKDFWAVYGECDGTHTSGPQASTYWCGLYGMDMFYAMNCDLPLPLPNNMDMLIPLARLGFIAHLMGQRGSGNPLSDWSLPALGPQILCDKANILAMNGALIDTIMKLPGKIDEVVPNILKANLPERQVDADDFQYYLYQNRTPISNFMFLNNKKEDERRFLAFAGPHYDREVRKTFNKKQDDGGQVGSGSKAGGVNHWFVRHNGTRRANNSDTGIQRAYLFGPSGNSSGYQDKPSFALTEPSCKNNDADNDSNPNTTSALVAEWHWSATKWLCFPVVDGWVHIPLISQWECDHCLGGSTIDREKNNCTWPVLDGNLGVPCPTLFPPTLLLPCAGGGRAYGDDPKLLSGGAKSAYYTGALCMPLILNRTFFGKQGSLVVGVSRTCKNPWDEIFGTISQGLFKAFNPTVKNMWAVSAARAGYRDPSDKGRYQLAYTDPAPLSSSSSPEQLKKNWNLKETDWDAVFLPVKDAWKLCMGSNVESPGTFTMDLGSSDVLGTIMTEQWQGLNGGSAPAFGQVSAPHKMSGNLDWSGLSEKLTH